MKADKKDLYLAYKDAIAGMDFPSAVLDYEKFRANIEHHLERSKGKFIRIATKSLRIPEIIQELIAEYPSINGAMAYHGREAIYLASLGIRDILMGYPIVHKGILDQIAQCNKNEAPITLMADLPQHIEQINHVGKKYKVVMPICIDIDLSMDIGPIHFGVYRSSIKSIEELDILVEKLKTCESIRLEGIMGYEAQIAGVTDTAKEYGLKNIAIKYLKSTSIKRIAAWRSKVVKYIESKGIELRIVNGGGTGSMDSTMNEQVVTEVTVGSGFFAPHLFDNYRSFKLAPALVYALQITRSPGPDVFTAHGGGFIASGKIEWLKQPKVYLPQGIKLFKEEGVGEVQTPFRYKGNIDLNLGDPIFLRHAKAGELLDHFNEVQVFENGKILKELLTYRGHVLQF